MKTRATYRRRAFTLVEIMIVVAIIGILAAIAVPNFVKNRKMAQAASCIRNMQQLETAAENYRTFHNMAVPDSFDILVGPTEYLREMPKCPSGGDYVLTPEDSDDGLAIMIYCSFGGNHSLYVTSD